MQKLTAKEKDRIRIYCGLGLAALMTIGAAWLLITGHYRIENQKLSRILKSERIKQYQTCVMARYPSIKPAYFGLWIDGKGQTFNISGTHAAIECGARHLLRED